jgi:hypothetical protein
VDQLNVFGGSPTPLGGLPWTFKTDDGVTMVKKQRGTHYPYPCNALMIKHLVSSGVTFAGWFSQRSLEDMYDLMNAQFYMNRNSARFWRVWKRDPRPDPRYWVPARRARFLKSTSL